MKITKKCVLALATALFLTNVAFAQEGFGDFGGDDFGSDDFGGGSDEFTPEFTFNGSAEVIARLFPRRNNLDFNNYDYDSSFTDFRNKATWANADFTLGANYSGAFSDFDAKLKFNRSILNDYREDILQEFTARVYLGNFQVEAGKMKLVWGKGDKVHVLDNFNANDYTDFIVPDYIDRRIAEPMFHLVYNTPFNARFEGVYTPWMTPDRLAASGMWQPGKAATLTSTVENMIKDYALGQTTTPGATAALLYASTFKADSLYSDTKQLKYSQAGLRSTFTLGSVDLGASYYYGHYKQPSSNSYKTILYNALHTDRNTKKYTSDYTESLGYALAYQAALAKAKAAGQEVTDAAVQAAVKAQVESGLAGLAATYAHPKTGLPELDYDQLQVFGLEAATVIGPFNTRAELAYNLTKDIAGDDPWIHNNSIAWEAGFDINLPIHNINLNFQTTGKYILNNDKIKDGGITVPGLGFVQWSTLGTNYDTDYDATGKYIRNQFIVDITDTFNHEKIKLDVKGIFQLETRDLMILPSLSFRLGGDDFTLSLSGLYIWCDDETESEYYAWRNNDFVSVGIKYQF
ncbi:MAG: hypothetical protein IJS09_08655 [Treponema sp.]|nr:hypothetical protein [Treponema sp.]